MIHPLDYPCVPKTDLRRVAVLFSGGPAPAANAVIASAAICFAQAGIEVLGIRNGYTYLMEYKPGQMLEEGKAYIRLDRMELEGVRSSPGIIIGTARANPGKKVKTAADLQNEETTAPLRAVYEALRSLKVDALLSIGGDDTLTTAAKFYLWQQNLPASEPRIRILHLPKTIDNDYRGIDFTFGYFTAVEMLATQVRNLLADARSTGAYYLVQVMGRAAGWLAYGAAIAGEASFVVSLEDIPEAWWIAEDTFDPKSGQKVLDAVGKTLSRKVIDIQALVDRMVHAILARDRDGKPYGVILMAEGIVEYLPLEELRQSLSEDEYRVLTPDEFGHFPVSQLKYSGRLGRLINDEYQKRTGKKKKMTGLQFGYEVRCHPSTAFDVILGSQLGVGAYRALIERGQDAVMVSVGRQLSLVYEPFSNLIDMTKLRAIARPLDPQEDFHQLARYLEVRVQK